MKTARLHSSAATATAACDAVGRVVEIDFSRQNPRREFFFADGRAHVAKTAAADLKRTGKIDCDEPESASGIPLFLQRDPAGFVDGYNLYAYVTNNPLRFVDPTGLSGFDMWDLLNTDIEDLSSLTYEDVSSAVSDSIDRGGDFLNNDFQQTFGASPTQVSNEMSQIALDDFNQTVDNHPISGPLLSIGMDAPYQGLVSSLNQNLDADTLTIMYGELFGVLPGTISLGVDIDGGAGGFMVDFDLSLAVDPSGDAAVIGGLGIGGFTNLFTGSIGLDLGYSNVQSVSDLNGVANTVGLEFGTSLAMIDGEAILPILGLGVDPTPLPTSFELSIDLFQESQYLDINCEEDVLGYVGQYIRDDITGDYTGDYMIHLGIGKTLMQGPFPVDVVVEPAGFGGQLGPSVNLPSIAGSATKTVLEWLAGDPQDNVANGGGGQSASFLRAQKPKRRSARFSDTVPSKRDYILSLFH